MLAEEERRESVIPVSSGWNGNLLKLKIELLWGYLLKWMQGLVVLGTYVESFKFCCFPHSLVRNLIESKQEKK